MKIHIQLDPMPQRCIVWQALSKLVVGHAPSFLCYWEMTKCFSKEARNVTSRIKSKSKHISIRSSNKALRCLNFVSDEVFQHFQICNHSLHKIVVFSQKYFVHLFSEILHTFFQQSTSMFKFCEWWSFPTLQICNHSLHKIVVFSQKYFVHLFSGNPRYANLTLSYHAIIKHDTIEVVKEVERQWHTELFQIICGEVYKSYRLIFA